MLYLDSSALVKLVLPEPETGALRERLASSASEVTSVIAAIEVPRAVARVTGEEQVMARVDEVLARVDLRALDEEVVALARGVPAAIRSLDAVHLATAQSMRDGLDGIVVYDRRLAEAAADADLDVITPGA